MNLDDIIEGRFSPPALSTDIVYYAFLPTSVSQANALRLRNVLDAEERAKADRYRFEKDRVAFTICRGALRLLLGRFTNTGPQLIKFTYGPHGKPELSGLRSSNLRTSDVRFNVSHSGEIALIGLTLGREIGVDVEVMRPQLDFLSLARTSFSPTERDLVAAKPLDQQAGLFYEFWSCKEACIKADSRGLGVSLAQFGILANGGNSPWRNVSVMPTSNLAPDTRVRVLDGGAGYAAAVAARGKDWDVWAL